MFDTQSQLCTFHLGSLILGVEVGVVQEVIRAQDMTRVPLAPPCIRGLINLRGQIVTALDMRRRLNLEARGSDQVPMNVVIRTGSGTFSLLVDSIGDVIEMDASVFEPTPATLDEDIRDLIKGVYKLEGTLLLVVDVEKTVNFEHSSVHGLGGSQASSLTVSEMSPESP